MIASMVVLTTIFADPTTMSQRWQIRETHYNSQPSYNYDLSIGSRNIASYSLLDMGRKE